MNNSMFQRPKFGKIPLLNLSIFRAPLLILIVLVSFIFVQTAFAAHGLTPKKWSGANKPELEQIDVGGLKRSFYLYVPETAVQPAPTVFVFHGSGGNAWSLDYQVGGIAKLADEKGFVVVYPSGIDKHWNDGRQIQDLDRQDDIAFISKVIDQLVELKVTDASRIYACGISNGGFFSQYLAVCLKDRIAAVASVAASVWKDLTEVDVSPEPIMLVLGTKDPLVPFKGGRIGGTLLRNNRSTVLSCRQSLAFWCEHNHVSEVSLDEKLPNVSDRDHCQVIERRCGESGSPGEVLLYEIDGGGHTWPGGLQYLPAALVGHVCRDFNCNEAIWQFFSKHHR